jgi:hypothetical protein
VTNLINDIMKVMEENVKTRKRIFKGGGSLMGVVAGAATGVLAVILTGQMGIIGAVSAAVSLPVGLLLEKKFQQGAETGKDVKSTIAYVAWILLGVALFLICFFLVK